MSSSYPAQIDSTLTLPTVIDNSTPVTGSSVNRLRDTIIYVESELGIKPSGIYGTVRKRLEALETGLGGVVFTAGGDLGGNYITQVVIGLQGHPVSATAPTAGQVISWDGAAWSPTTMGSSALTGTSANGNAINLLDSNNNPFILQNDNAYTIKITIIANRTDDPGDAMWIYDVLAHCSLNRVVVDNYNLTFEFTNGNAWTTNIQYDGSSNHIDIVFTGSLGQTIDVKASIESVQLAGFIVTEDMSLVLNTEFNQSLETESGQLINIDV